MGRLDEKHTVNCKMSYMWKWTSMHHCSCHHFYHLQSQAACWVSQVDSGLAMNRGLVQISSCRKKYPDLMILMHLHIFINLFSMSNEAVKRVMSASLSPRHTAAWRDRGAELVVQLSQSSVTILWAASYLGLGGHGTRHWRDWHTSPFQQIFQIKKRYTCTFK